ncbi:hypothetical protein CTEN210_09039 [Chaetoceros tenuissimus]|uniref:Leucine-rich repeat-containing N-terminal plant-type domain-containing protein n=1 Tax=Chaetoceros tenuissimus TaxID=426638 RepID=A0AAD3H782_9STRA|nr:hypothetical protein CTEN210_09039 [Chaetoceros tenuissimus]
MAPTIVAAYLEGIIASVVENNDFSSYNQDNLDTAKIWFQSPSNHPADFRENGDEYMKECFILALIYSAACNNGCRYLSKWLSTVTHCKWQGLSCNETKEITELNLWGRGLNGAFTLFGMKSLEVLDIRSNNINSFTVAGESTNIKRISFFENRLRSFKGGGTFTKLKSLHLGFNQLSDDFIITREDFPTSIKHLDLSGNGLTGVRGLEVLTNLQNLQLGGNKLEGDFIVNKENFPTSIKMLSLRRNQLTGFVGGAILTSLEKLWIDNNEISGDLMITAENFPPSIKYLWMHTNKLTSVDAEPGVGLNLESLILSFQNNDGIMAKDELCKRRPELTISPSDACSLGKMTPAYLESIIASVIDSNDFSSYNQDDFDVAKSWFLNPSNHLIDNEIGAEYMKVRSFVLHEVALDVPYLIGSQEKIIVNGGKVLNVTHRRVYMKYLVEEDVG